VPPVGVPLDPLVMGDVHARTLPPSRRATGMVCPAGMTAPQHASTADQWRGLRAGTASAAGA